MKELEALEEIQHELMQRHNDLYCDDDCDKELLDTITKYVKEKFDLIKKALTPPTQEEVCAKLSEYLEQDVEWVSVSFVGDDDICYICQDNLIVFNYDLPPHLITLIGKFYEGLEE